MGWWWWVIIMGIVADHQWQLLLVLNFVSQVYVLNFKSVIHFLLVDFGWWVTIPGMVADPLRDDG